MQKIMIISFYDLIEYFAAIKKEMEMLGYIVSNYPLFRFAYDQYDKKKDYFENMVEQIKNENPKIILWFFHDVPSKIFQDLRKIFQDKIFIFYNFDEPLNISTEIFLKCKMCDIIMTTSDEYFENYCRLADIDKKFLLYNPFGCDEKFFYNDDKLKDSYYECDIGMLCYNLLYDTDFFNAQEINKINMIKNVIEYANKNKKIFKIFGSPLIKEFFPENYYGDISYINKNKLFNLAKIMICQSSFNDKSLYFDENILSMMSSGALVMTTKAKNMDNIFTNKKNILYLNKHNYIRQIDSILNNIDKYNEIKQGAIELSKQYSWGKWALKLHKIITKKLFDQQIYADIYEIKYDDATYDHWLEYGCPNNHISTKFDIPANFNDTEYAKKYMIENRSREYLYYHWYHHDKSDIYLTTSKNINNFNPEDHFISICKLYEVCTYFDNIKYDCPENLEKINTISKNHPYCNMNKILDYYFNII